MHDSTEATYLAGARRGNAAHFTSLVEPYHAELRVHCYRLLGSLQDAEDQVQETLLRAWRRLSTFEGRGSFRAWLYKIATNVCLDALTKRSRRSLPTSTHPPADPQRPFSPPAFDPIWLEPYPDALLTGIALDPEAHYSTRESVRLAFMVALQSLPPRQRAVLILRDVLNWRAKEAAALLEMTVPAVNSALHRARSTLATHYHPGGLDHARPTSLDQTTQKLLDQYVEAWEAADVIGLTALLKEDATFTMPPSPSWYHGRAAIQIFLRTTIFVDRWRLQPTLANAQIAFGVYKRNQESNSYQASAIQVLTLEGERVAGVVTFVNPALFAYFNLPFELGAR